MSFLQSLFGGKSDSENHEELWEDLTTIEDLDRAEKESFEKKVVLFKHSTRCFISKTVLRNFERQMSDDKKDVKFYFLDLIKHRDISNEIENRFGVTHQSPQLLVLENGKAIKNASHQSIDLSLV